MSRYLLALAVAAVVAGGASSAAAQDKRPPTAENTGASPTPKSPPKIERGMVTVTEDNIQLSCYLARQVKYEPMPGLLLVHEWWGLNDWVKKQADRYAEQGYVVLAVDLYRGEVAQDAEHAHELMRGLTDERALADLRAAFTFLHEHNATRGQPVGVMGWCMGGGYALRLAIAEPKVACTVICYGKPVTDVEQLRRIKGPILGIWGARDRGIEVQPFKQALDKAEVRSTHRIYPHVGHAFLNETNKDSFKKEQAVKAWEEIDRFLTKELKKR